MLSKHNSIQRDQLEMITLDQLVPANHLVRKIEGAIFPLTKEGFFRKHDYVYDEHFNCYLCHRADFKVLNNK